MRRRGSSRSLGAPNAACLAVWGPCVPSQPTHLISSHSRPHQPCATSPLLFCTLLLSFRPQTVLKSSNANLFRSKPLPLPCPTPPPYYRRPGPSRAQCVCPPQARRPEPGAPYRRAAEAPSPHACPACEPYFIPIQPGQPMPFAGCAALVRLGAAYVPTFFLPFGYTHCHATRVPRRLARPRGSRPQGAFSRVLASAHCLLLFCLLLPNRNPTLPRWYSLPCPIRLTTQ